MIKAFFQIIILSILFLSCKKQTDNKVLHKINYIDSIQNAKQITDLILKIDNRYNEFKINDSLKFENRHSDKNYTKIADSLKVQPWTKADFDNNGLSDILVIGKWYDHSVICILDKNGKYELKPITRRSFQNCTFPVVENNKILF